MNFWPYFSKYAALNLSALRSLVTTKVHPAIRAANTAMSSAYTPMQSALRGGMRRADILRPHIERFQAAQPKASGAMDHLWGLLDDISNQGIMSDAAPYFNKYFGIATNLQNKFHETDKALRSRISTFLQKPAVPDQGVWTANAAINAAKLRRQAP